MFDGPGSPVTQTFGLGLFAAIRVADLEQIETFFAERGAPAIHEVSPLAGVPLVQLLSERGYQPIELTTVMYQPLPAEALPARPRNPHLTVRVMEPEEQELWSRTSLGGWSTEFADTEMMLNFGKAVSLSEGSIAFFAELGNQPIATAVLRCSEGVAFFAGASTLPEARNQGAQQALLNARLSVARDRECDVAMMCTAPGSTSQHNAERHGFRIAYTRTKWQSAQRMP